MEKLVTPCERCELLCGVWCERQQSALSMWRYREALCPKADNIVSIPWASISNSLVVHFIESETPLAQVYGDASYGCYASSVIGPFLCY